MYGNEPLDPKIICIICGFKLSESKAIILRSGLPRPEAILSSSIQRRDVEVTQILRCFTKLLIHGKCEDPYNNAKRIEADLRRKEKFGELNLDRLWNDHDGLDVKPDFFKTCLFCESDISIPIDADEEEKTLKSKEFMELRNIRAKQPLLKILIDWGDVLPEHMIRRIQIGLKVIGARYHKLCSSKCETIARTKQFDFENFLTTVAVERINTFLEANAEQCYSIDELMEILDLRCNTENLLQKFQLKYGKTYHFTKTEPILICSYGTAGDILKQWQENSLSNSHEEKMETVGLAAEIILEDLESSTNTLQNGNINIPESLSLFVNNLVNCNNDSDSVETIAKALLSVAQSGLSSQQSAIQNTKNRKFNPGFTNQESIELGTEGFLLDSLCDNLI